MEKKQNQVNESPFTYTSSAERHCIELAIALSAAPPETV